MMPPDVTHDAATIPRRPPDASGRADGREGGTPRVPAEHEADATLGVSGGIDMHCGGAPVGPSLLARHQEHQERLIGPFCGA